MFGVFRLGSAKTVNAAASRTPMNNQQLADIAENAH
jgi:hypothetical protein